MALDVLARNYAALGPEHIAGLGGEQKDALRNALMCRGGLSFYLWKLLLRPRAERCPSDDRLVPDPTATHGHFYAAQYRHPQSSLAAYTAALNAPSLEFIAHLRITTSLHAHFGAGELMQLATMPNLGVLEIVELDPDLSIRYEPPISSEFDEPDTMLSPYQVSDRLLKGWSLMRPTCFPALRVLRLWGCRSDVLTQACLQHAAQFPLLAHFDVSVDVVAPAAELRVRPISGHPGPSGAWSQVAQVASTFGWMPFAHQERKYRYSLRDKRDAESSRTPVPAVAGEASVPLDAQHWGAHLYSFLADEGYCAANKKRQKDIYQAGRELRGPPREAFALLSLGIDRSVRSRVSPRQARTYCFVRTREAMAARDAASHQQAPAEKKFPQQTDAKQTNAKHPSDTASPTADNDEGGAPPRPLAKRRRAERSIGSMLDDFAR